MSNALVLDGMIDFSASEDFGNIWVRLKKEVAMFLSGRSDTSVRHYWVIEQLQGHVQSNFTGVIYVTNKGKAVFWPMIDQEPTDVTEARYIVNPSSDVMTGKADGFLTEDKRGKLGEKASKIDMVFMVQYLYGEKAASELMARLSKQA